MGYLDKSTVTVDAILTKQGRKLLADGVGLNIRWFTLHDVGINYTLWNPNHTSGSAFYGEAIEELPQLEALPHAEYLYRSRIYTAQRGTTRLPVLLTTPQRTDTFFSDEPLTIIVSTRLAPEETEYHLVIPDRSIISCVSHTMVPVAGVTEQFVNEANIPYAVMSTGASPFKIVAEPDGVARTIPITLVGTKTGAYKTLFIDVPANLLEYENTDLG
jgi:hypothetical protein